jgi:hypothetical protein
MKFDIFEFSPFFRPLFYKVRILESKLSSLAK